MREQQALMRTRRVRSNKVAVQIIEDCSGPGASPARKNRECGRCDRQEVGPKSADSDRKCRLGRWDPSPRQEFRVYSRRSSPPRRSAARSRRLKNFRPSSSVNVFESLCSKTWKAIERFSAPSFSPS